MFFSRLLAALIHPGLEFELTGMAQSIELA
jgi:hypothetical protein